MKNIYGEETYLKGRSLIDFPKEYIVLDIETTGLSPSNCEIIEIAGIKIRNNSIVDTFETLVKPNNPLSEFVQKLTRLTDEMLLNAPNINDVLLDFIKFLGHDTLVGHNITFDLNFLRYNCHKILNCNFDNNYVDTLRLSRRLIQGVENYKLNTLANHFEIKQDVEHRALQDCITTYNLFNKLKEVNTSKEIEFISSIENIDKIFEGKIIVFKGQLVSYSYDVFEKICEMAGGCASQMFFAKDTDYIVFGKTTYLKYLRGDYSEKMIKAIALQKEGKLKILSEEHFFDILGIEHPKVRKSVQSKAIDTKSMSAEVDSFDETHPLFDRTCVFTGTLDKMPRKEAMQSVLNLGGQIGNGVTKNTNFLILGCNDYCKTIKDGKSIKQKKAEEYKLQGYDIEIIDEELFYSMLSDGN